MRFLFLLSLLLIASIGFCEKVLLSEPQTQSVSIKEETTIDAIVIIPESKVMLVRLISYKEVGEERFLTDREEIRFEGEKFKTALAALKKGWSNFVALVKEARVQELKKE